MGTVFQSIYAELSTEFEALLSEYDARNFLEKVCDVTGALMISNSNSAVEMPDTLKICGSWTSVSHTYNILSAYTIMKSISKTEMDENERNLYNNEMTDYLSAPKRKRGRPFKIVSNHFTNDKQSSLNDPVKGKLQSFSELSDVSVIRQDYNETSPVPILMSSTDRSREIPVILSSSFENNKSVVSEGGKTSLLNNDYDSHIYIVENVEDNTLESEEFENQSSFTEERKGEFSCALCQYKTSNSRNLELHLDRFHFKPVSCHICGRGFGYERDLKRHLMRNKYSCGSRRSVINENYVNTKQMSETEINELKNDTKRSREGFVENEKQGENNEGNFVVGDHNLSIKQEPMDSDDHEESTTQTLSGNMYLQTNKNSLDLQLHQSTLSLDSQEKIRKKKSLENNCIANLEDLTESNDSLKISDNTGSHSNDLDPQSQKYHLDNVERTQSNITSPVLRESMFFPTANIDTDDDDDFITSAKSASFACKHCTYTAYKRQHIIDHVCRMHKKQFPCCHCDSMFGLVKDLNRHLRRSHGVDIPLKNSRGMVIEPLNKT